MRLSPFATFFSLAATLAPPQISASLADVVRRKRTNKADQLFKVDADGLGLDEVDTLDDNDLNDLWSEANDATFFKDERMLENSYRMLGRDSSSMSYPNRIDKPPYDSSDEYIPPPPPPPPPPSVDGPTPRPPSPDGPTPSPPSPDGPTPSPPTPEGPTSPPEPSGPTIPPEPTEPTNPPEPSTSPAPTSAGDNCLEGTTREDYLLNLLSPITSPELLEDPDTPQGQAFEFLVDDDFDPCTYPTIYQRYGLSVLFFSTEGDDWDEDEGWLEIGVNECDWFNVTCGETDPDFVVAVHLEDNNLVGPLPPEISTLWTTEVLIFFDNALSSSIPEGIGNLTKLGLLDLESNDLTGTLFTESILGLTELQALRVSFNQLNGSIPEDITSLSKLTQLWLAVNQFSGGIPPELGELQSLETLLLYNNTFAGEIPEELGSLSNLTQLRLSGNVLDGGIPEEIYNANKLRVLRVDFNFMSGEISTNIGNLVELEDFRVNQQFPPGFTGSIPSELSQCTLLRNLLLNDNGFSGAFPNIFEDFEILEFVDVSNNDFSDEIPFSIFEVDTLRIAYFSNNSFTGPVPETFSSPPDLEDLYFDGNELSGNIPSIPADSLTALTELLFERNDLTGDMPQSICNLRNNDTGTAVLVALGSDCAGDPPEVNCSFPDCCNRCFS